MSLDAYNREYLFPFHSEDLTMPVGNKFPGFVSHPGNDAGQRLIGQQPDGSIAASDTGAPAGNVTPGSGAVDDDLTRPMSAGELQASLDTPSRPGYPGCWGVS